MSYGPPVHVAVALPAAFFPADPGRECAGTQVYSEMSNDRSQSCDVPVTIADARKFVKRSIRGALEFVQALDKLSYGPMIPTASRCRRREMGRWHGSASAIASVWWASCASAAG